MPTSLLPSGLDRYEHTKASGVYQPADLGGYSSDLTGADVFSSGDTLRNAFPFIGDQAVGGIHVRRAGWLSAQQLGAWMLEEAITAGAECLTGEITSVQSDKNGITSVVVDGQATVTCKSFVNAGVHSPKRWDASWASKYRCTARSIRRCRSRTTRQDSIGPHQW